MLGRIKKPATIIAGLALFGFVIFQIGAASNHQKREVPQQENRGENANTTGDRSRGGAAIDIECDPNCNAKPPNDDRNESYFSRVLRKTFDDPLTILTGVLALATFGLVVGVIFQVRDGRRSSERQLRAYLMIQDVKFARPD